MPHSPDTPGADVRVVTSPLVRLLDDVLSRTAGYRITPAFAALLNDDPLLLAALQRLAFAAIAQQGTKEG